MRSSLRKQLSRLSSKGFTIVEVVVVITVIGILAAITVVGYGAWQRSVVENTIKSDLQGAVSALENARNFDNQYPADVNTVFTGSDSVTLVGGATNGGAGFCIAASSSKNLTSFYFSSSNDRAEEGDCPNLFP